MHLERIELTNFRQHRRLDVDFNGNLIAILGRNGSGKSNLIGGIQFALTGEQPGFTKADLTTWGEKEGSVRLFFTAGAKNERFCITRKTNGDVVLKVGDETIKQARKVEDALRERAGLDKDLIRQVVFVNQKEIDRILSADPKDRELALQRIAGIAVASKIYDYLRPEIAAYDKPQGFDEAIARAKVQLSDQEAAVGVYRTVLAKYDDALKALPSREKLEAEVDRCAGADSAVSEFARLSGALERAQDEHEKALAKLAGMGAVSEAEEENIRTESSALAEERERLQNEQSEAKDSLRLLNRMKELADAASKSKVELEAEQTRAEEVARRFGISLSDDKAEVDRLGAEQVAAESELRSLHNLVQSASSDGTCPVCGAAASQEDIERHLAEKMSAAELKASEACEKAKRARMAYDKRQAEESAAREAVERKRTKNEVAFAALKKAHDANVEGCEIDLNTFKVAYKGKTPDDIPSVEKRCDEIFKRIQDISSRMSQLSLDLARISSVKNEAKGARDDAARLSAQIGVLMGSKRECAERLAALGIDPASVALGDGGACSEALRKARENLNAYNGIMQDMAAEKGKLGAAEQTIESTKMLIDDLVEKKSIEESVQAKVDTLKRTRDWFNYKVGPRIVSQCVMKDLTESVNMFLDQFNAPFVVDADEEGCGFRCRFIDGRTMPDPYPEAHMLSGGQKVALAFAFHIAIYMRFGGQLGFLSLDEPTAYLDDANIEHMGELLEKVGAVARNKGLQILMATHEKAIMPFLDTKIDLGAMKGE